MKTLAAAAAEAGFLKKILFVFMCCCTGDMFTFDARAAVNSLPGSTNVALVTTPPATNIAGATGDLQLTDASIGSTPVEHYRFCVNDTFDPQTTSTGISSYSAGNATNVSVGIVPGVGVNGSAALQIVSSFSKGPYSYGCLAGQWQNESMEGNTDTNLSHYVLSFDAYVTGDPAHQSGGGFELVLQESADQDWPSTFPQGTLQTYQAYEGGSDLLLPQSGVWKHFAINLGGPTFQSTHGFNHNFDPTGGTWQINFQMNAADWGDLPQTNSTLIIDNIVLTVLTPH